ncbi:MAG: hypothetical protein Q7U66_01440 [Methylobacter sp.]|nr:hypothetical protein [Methylobacter sp.]
MKAILQSNLDKLPASSPVQLSLLPQDHANIRGANSFHYPLTTKELSKQKVLPWLFSLRELRVFVVLYFKLMHSQFTKLWLHPCFVLPV